MYAHFDVEKDFEKDIFYKKFNRSLLDLDVFSDGQALSDIDYKNNNLFIEETETGRALFFDKNGKIVWQYFNRAKNGKMYTLNLSRLIIDKNLIKKIKNNLKNNKC